MIPILIPHTLVIVVRFHVERSVSDDSWSHHSPLILRLRSLFVYRLIDFLVAFVRFATHTATTHHSPLHMDLDYFCTSCTHTLLFHTRMILPLVLCRFRITTCRLLHHHCLHTLHTPSSSVLRFICPLHVVTPPRPHTIPACSLHSCLDDSTRFLCHPVVLPFTDSTRYVYHYSLRSPACHAFAHFTSFWICSSPVPFYACRFSGFTALHLRILPPFAFSLRHTLGFAFTHTPACFLPAAASPHAPHYTATSSPLLHTWIATYALPCTFHGFFIPVGLISPTPHHHLYTTLLVSHYILLPLFTFCTTGCVWVHRCPVHLLALPFSAGCWFTFVAFADGYVPLVTHHRTTATVFTATCCRTPRHTAFAGSPPRTFCTTLAFSHAATFTFYVPHHVLYR